MPASCSASRTASATASTTAIVPISSGAKARVPARPIARRLPPPAVDARPALRVKTVACGDSTPSQPPDQTKAIRCPTSSGEQPRCLASISWYESVAKPRVKSLAPPLPSVLPISATIAAGSSTPAAIRRSSSDTSLGAAIATLWTPDFHDLTPHSLAAPGP